MQYALRDLLNYYSEIVFFWCMLVSWLYTRCFFEAISYCNIFLLCIECFSEAIFFAIYSCSNCIYIKCSFRIVFPAIYSFFHCIRVKYFFATVFTAVYSYLYYIRVECFFEAIFYIRNIFPKLCSFTISSCHRFQLFFCHLCNFSLCFSLRRHEMSNEYR